jgi:hypothetical protein
MAASDGSIAGVSTGTRPCILLTFACGATVGAAASGVGPGSPSALARSAALRRWSPEFGLSTHFEQATTRTVAPGGGGGGLVAAVSAVLRDPHAPLAGGATMDENCAGPG